MTPGKYTERITFVDIVENDDGIGGGSVFTSELITVWASVVAFNSNQALLYSQLTSLQGYNIECRYLKTFDITTKNGIKYEDKMLTIHSCVEDSSLKLKIIAFEQ
jgi:SPP1 family predicted phage head-tail adaptor